MLGGRLNTNVRIWKLLIKRINEVANDHLDGLEDSLKHMDIDSIKQIRNK